MRNDLAIRPGCTLLSLSGGLDSATLATKLIAEGKCVIAAYVDFHLHYSHEEFDAAQNVAAKLDIPLHRIDFRGVGDLMQEFGRIPELPTLNPGETPKAPMGGYTILAVLSYLARLVRASELAVGYTREDIAYYPGLKTLLREWPGLIRAIDDLDTQSSDQFRLLAPLQSLSKSEVIRLGASHNTPFHLTYSCAHGQPMHCGVCPCCIERRAGFKGAGESDPTNYAGDT